MASEERVGRRCDVIGPAPRQGWGQPRQTAWARCRLPRYGVGLFDERRGDGELSVSSPPTTGIMLSAMVPVLPGSLAERAAAGLRSAVPVAAPVS
jgi:hypothetical protein